MIDASQLLRPGLLQGVSILLAGAAAPEAGPDAGAASAGLGESVASACAGLGARVFACELSLDGQHGQEQSAVERAAQDAVERALADGMACELLAIDAASVFAQALAGAVTETEAGAGGGAGGAREALRACLDATWNVTRTVAAAALLPDERGGRVVYLAPPAGGGEHADAARAGLENLARTLSIEWSRHGITTVAIAPGEATPASEVAALVAYLASPAGAYFSGCLLDLRGAGLG